MTVAVLFAKPVSFTKPVVSDCTAAHDMPAAARIKPLFRLDHPQLQQALFGLQNVSNAQLQGAANRWLGPPWSSIAAKHLLALSKRSNGRVDHAFTIYTDPDGPAKGALNALSDSPQVLWVAAVMEQTASNAVVLALEADAQLMLEGDSSKVRKQDAVCTAAFVSGAPCTAFISTWHAGLDPRGGGVPIAALEKAGEKGRQHREDAVYPSVLASPLLPYL